MRRKDFWNNVAKHGLLIGVIMGSSRIVEYGLMLSANVSMYALLTVEWMLVALLFGVLMYRAVWCRTQAIYDEVGFSFSRSLNYAMMVAVFASFIVSAMSFVYINSYIGGYDIYLIRLISSLTSVIEQAQIENTVTEIYGESLKVIESGEASIPSLFDTILSTLSIYILAGASVGVIIAFIIKRSIKTREQNG